jgi:hypothetical protein
MQFSYEEERRRESRRNLDLLLRHSPPHHSTRQQQRRKKSCCCCAKDDESGGVVGTNNKSAEASKNPDQCTLYAFYAEWEKDPFQRDAIFYFFLFVLILIYSLPALAGAPGTLIEELELEVIDKNKIF